MEIIERINYRIGGGKAKVPQVTLEKESYYRCAKILPNDLKSANKKRTGKVGFPKYVGVVKDYIIVIEDKPKTDKHVLLDGTVVSMKTKAVTDYVVNVALFYAKHLANNTLYKKAIAIGVSGDERDIKLVHYTLMKRNIIGNLQMWNPLYHSMKKY